MKTMLSALTPPSIWAPGPSSVLGHMCIRLDRWMKKRRVTLWTQVWWWRAPSAESIRWDTHVYKVLRIVLHLFFFLDHVYIFLMGVTLFFDACSALNRFVLMENVAMHLSSKLTSAIICAMDTGWVSLSTRQLRQESTKTSLKHRYFFIYNANIT